MPSFKITAAAAALSVFGIAAATAMPASIDIPADSNVTLVSGGCGFNGHRNPYGYCVPNRPIYRACPPGFHLGPYRRQCWPNR